MVARSRAGEKRERAGAVPLASDVVCGCSISPTMSTPLARTLAVLAADLSFASMATESADDGPWKELAKRREPAYLDALRGGGASGPWEASAEARDAWLLSLARAMAAVSPPGFLPMNELVDAVGLAGGARGLKSLFSSKPSEKDLDRVRRVAATAVRVAASGMAANGALTGDEARLLRLIAASFGLAPADEPAIATPASVDPQALELASDLDAKTSRLLVRGAWLAAVQDGLDVPDEGVVAVLANRLGVPMQDSGALGAEVKKEGEQRTALARAAIECVAYVQRDEVARGAGVALVAAELLLPMPFRDGALAPFTMGTAPVLPTTKPGEKARRHAALAIAWAAALMWDPTFSRRAVLAERLDAAAGAIGAGGDGPRVRHDVETFLEAELAQLAGKATALAGSRDTSQWPLETRTSASTSRERSSSSPARTRASAWRSRAGSRSCVRTSCSPAATPRRRRWRARTSRTTRATTT